MKKLSLTLTLILVFTFSLVNSFPVLAIANNVDFIKVQDNISVKNTTKISDGTIETNLQLSDKQFLNESNKKAFSNYFGIERIYQNEGKLDLLLKEKEDVDNRYEVKGSLNILGKNGEFKGSGTMKEIKTTEIEDEFLYGTFSGEIVLDNGERHNLNFNKQYSRELDKSFVSFTIGTDTGDDKNIPIILNFGETVPHNYQLEDETRSDKLINDTLEREFGSELPFQDDASILTPQGRTIYMALYHYDSLDDTQPELFAIRAWGNIINAANRFEALYGGDYQDILPYASYVTNVDLKLELEPGMHALGSADPESGSSSIEISFPVILPDPIGLTTFNFSHNISSIDYERDETPGSGSLNIAKWEKERTAGYLNDWDSDVVDPENDYINPWNDPDDHNGFFGREVFNPSGTINEPIVANVKGTAELTYQIQVSHGDGHVTIAPYPVLVSNITTFDLVPN